MIIKHLFFWLLLSFMLPCLASEQYSIEQLKNLDLEELLEVETFNPEASLAARKKQKLTDTAAALFVITQEDIRRAGITNLAEALRMAPGVQVAQINAHQWAVSARGFNGAQASQLLVMIDGRTVYTPLRSGVYWNLQDTLIEDVERIEVIRGPGGALWGANAVNGVINIITKATKDTQGSLVTSYFGKGEERAILGVRHGGKLGNQGHYRVYGKFYEYDSSVDNQEIDQDNDWQMKRGGFRMDWAPSERDYFTLQGDIYDGFVNRKARVFTSPTTSELDVKNQNSGFNLLARWQRNFVDGDIVLQSYYDRSRRDDFVFEEIRDIYDLDFQHRWQLSQRHEFLWGLGFRYTQDDTEGTPTVSFFPKKREDKIFSAFVQSEFKFTTNRKNESNRDLRLILGSKFEHNDYTGFEFQPSIRLLWNLNEKHNVWAAVSRAVRTPSRSEENIKANAGTNDLRVVIQGNPDFSSEILYAYELGYRFNLSKNFLLDTALFYNDYKKLRTLEPVDFKPFPPPATLVSTFDNRMKGEVYGLEIASHWQVTKTWKLIGTYSYLDMQLHLIENSQADQESQEGDNPHHQATLRSYLSLPYDLELDTALYYVDNLSNRNISNYTRFDLRLGWRPMPNIELSLGGRNIFDRYHSEFDSGEGRIANKVERAFYIQFKSKF